jgi:ABC-type xylose transport system substrate-binding protein
MPPTETTLRARQVFPAYKRVCDLEDALERLKDHVSPNDPLAAVLVSALATTKATRTSINVLGQAAERAAAERDLQDERRAS